MYQYDFSNPKVVQTWATGIAAAVKAGGHAGVFIDGYQGWHECQPKPPGTVATGHLPGCPSEASAGLRTTVGNRTINTTALLQVR